MNDLENLIYGSQNLFLCEFVQHLPSLLDVLYSEKVLYNFDCVALSKVARRERELDSRDCRLLSFRVTQASVEINTTIEPIDMSSIAGVGAIGVHILRRLTKRSIDSSKSASTSQLDITPLAA